MSAYNRLPRGGHFAPRQPAQRGGRRSRVDLLSLEDLVRYTHSLMSIVLEPALLEQGYTYVQTLVLLRLRDGTAVYPKEISAQIRYDNGALTRVIDQLVDRGLLERMRCEQDRRKVKLLLMPTACNTIDALTKVVVGTLTRAVADFSDSEVQTLRRLLTKLTTALRSTLETGAADTTGSRWSAQS